METKPETPWHALPAAQVLRRLDGDADAGLSAEEADRRRQKWGRNILTTRQGPGPLRRFLLQFHQPLVYILLAAGGASVYLDHVVDAAVIFGVVAVNAVVGFIQEAKAVSALSALTRTMVTEATILRDGSWTRRPAEELVPGDVVLLRSGDKVPADVRLLSVQNLRVDESALTGESAPVAKDAAPAPADALLAERTGLAHAATVVTFGQARGVVAAIGDATEIGRISALTAEADALATPLTRSIARFGRLMLAGILILAGLAFGVGVWRGHPPNDMFLVAVALAVGAIPEGLPAAVTVILAMGVSRMAARRAVIRRLPAVETLGSTTVICTDKTGTLTENRMTVTEMAAGEHIWRITGVGHDLSGEFLPVSGPGDRDVVVECLRAAILCNDARLLAADGQVRAEGDPTEAALLVAAAKAGLSHADEIARLPRLAEVPFESERMYMATLHDAGPGAPRPVYVKGSMEAVLARCGAAFCPVARQKPLSVETVRRQAEAMGRQGLRVLALARGSLPETARDIAPEDCDSGLLFLGLAGMIDPPRIEAAAAVAACRRAGIMVKMITGDHPATALAVGKALGLDQDSEHSSLAALSGRDIEALSDEALAERAEVAPVFARVSPEQKLRLVRALQSRGHVVAMTGDGVNDAPALRQADIGVAMGAGGTEAAKEAADMVLTDDNFATIEAAVEEGRGVFDNLTKYIVWTLPTNLGEGLVILAAVLLDLTLPISPVQILWINMTTAGSLGLMLAFEPREPGVMDRPPRDPGRPILDWGLTRRVLLVGAVLLVCAFGLYQWELARGAGQDQARTVAVNVFVMVEALYLINCRSLTRSAFSLPLSGNRFVPLGLAAAIGLQLLFTYAPFMQKLFGSAPMAPMAWLRVLGAAVAGFCVVELEKRLFGSRGGQQSVA